MTEAEKIEKLEELLGAAVFVLKATFPSRKSPSINRIIDEADAILPAPEAKEVTKRA